MSYNGSGTFQINTTGQPVVGGTIVSSATFNALTADLATGLTTAITKDGQTATTARIPFAQGITSTLVTDASSTTTGSIITAGGVGIAKKLYIGGEINYGGVTLTNGVTGTGKMVLDTAPTIASVNLTTALTLAGAAGGSGQVLTSAGSGLPTWAAPNVGFNQAQIFTTSGSFTVPASGKFKVTIVGGGGSGGSYTAFTFGGDSGAGGGNVIKWFSGATPAATATVTIGTGGAAVSGNVNGNTGGASTFVLSGFTTLTASGGLMGLAGGGSTFSLGGAATGGDINVNGQNGGSSAFNGSGQQSLNSIGGSSLMGFGGIVFTQTANGQPGIGYGGGGTGAANNGTSGAGTNGICIVEY